MTFGDAIAGALPRLRGYAEKLMTDSCTVTRPGTPVTDPATGVTTTPQTLLYTGRVKIQTYEGYEQTPEAGGRSFTVQRYRADFPVDAFQPLPGDVVTITASPFDADKVGKRYRITAPFNKSLSTAQRCFVDEMPGEV
ncbi:DUF6093 family protein [Cellulosimicrobium sp. ES-005]|uniref:DUF6093 family protein n=1 Tax=Cellulosimicrobium sp. ES-005 TaxID=3163031 RepID=A0AAU8FYV5_9MICO